MLNKIEGSSCGEILSQTVAVWKNSFPEILDESAAIERLISKNGSHIVVIKANKTSKAIVIDNQTLKAIKRGAFAMYRNLVEAGEKEYANRIIQEHGKFSKK